MTGLHGEFFRRDDAGYEQARRAAVWNERKPERHPDAIAIARDEPDVVAAVRLALQPGRSIGIRSGGHSWVGNGVRDGGLPLDLSRLDDITVDPIARTAAVGPSAKGPAANEALAGHGLFFPTGDAPTVGIGAAYHPHLPGSTRPACAGPSTGSGQGATRRPSWTPLSPCWTPSRMASRSCSGCCGAATRSATTPAGAHRPRSTCRRTPAGGNRPRLRFSELALDIGR